LKDKFLCDGILLCDVLSLHHKISQASIYVHVPLRWTRQCARGNDQIRADIYCGVKRIPLVKESSNSKVICPRNCFCARWNYSLTFVHEAQQLAN